MQHAGGIRNFFFFSFPFPFPFFKKELMSTIIPRPGNLLIVLWQIKKIKPYE